MDPEVQGLVKILAGLLFLGLAAWLLARAGKSPSPEAAATHRLGAVVSLWASASFLLPGLEVL